MVSAAPTAKSGLHVQSVKSCTDQAMGRSQRFMYVVLSRINFNLKHNKREPGIGRVPGGSGS